MTVDIMLPYYGDVEHMKLAVKSVLAQHRDDWRLHIFDDGYPSPEPERWCGRIDDARVTYQKNDTNLGANGNYRKALGIAKAEIVVIMGADDIMLPNYLDTVLAAFEAFPEADIVQPGVQTIDENGVVNSPLPDAIKRWYAPKTSTLKLLEGQELATSLLRANWTYFPSLAWKTKTIQRLGFTENLDVVQDLALLLDTAADGGSLVLAPKLSFLYRRHSNSDSSVRALDGRRFDEERRYFRIQSQRFKDLGWKRSSRAASLHLTSRLNAGALIFKALSQGKTDSLPRLIKHATR